MNLITDGVTAVALGLEKVLARGNETAPAPQGHADPRPGRGILMIAGFGLLYRRRQPLAVLHGWSPENETLARTLAFTGMVIFEKLSVFAFRSFSTPCWRLGWFSNRPLIVALCAMLVLQDRGGLRTVDAGAPAHAGLSLHHWGLILALAAPLIIVPEIIK